MEFSPTYRLSIGHLLQTCSAQQATNQFEIEIIFWFAELDKNKVVSSVCFAIELLRGVNSYPSSFPQYQYEQALDEKI